MELRPLLVTRLANGALGTAVTGSAVLVAAEPPWSGAWVLPAAMLTALAGCVLTVRGYRLRVRCLDRTVHVHGWLRTRSVPAPAVSEVTDFPALRWRTASGRQHWTPLSAFVLTNGVIEPVRAHHEACTRRLAAWIRSHR